MLLQEAASKGLNERKRQKEPSEKRRILTPRGRAPKRLLKVCCCDGCEGEGFPVPDKQVLGVCAEDLIGEGSQGGKHPA